MENIDRSRIDSLIIADTNWERGVELVEFALKLPEVDSRGIRLLYADKDDEEKVAAMGANFSALVRDVMRNKKNNMVIMNYYAATQAKVLALLQQAEDEYLRSTRRFLVSCKTGSKIKEGLGQSRELVKHIPYNSDRSDYLEMLQIAIRQSSVDQVATSSAE